MDAMQLVQKQHIHSTFSKSAKARRFQLSRLPIRLLGRKAHSIFSAHLQPQVHRMVHESETTTRQNIYETHQRNVEDTQKKLDRILGFLIDGTISKEQYSSQKSELEEELKIGKIKLGEVEARAKNWTELTENVVHFAHNAKIAFENGDQQTRREIMSSLGLNHRLEGKKLFIDLHSWFLTLKKGENELMPQIERLERGTSHNAKGRTEDYSSIRPRLCAVLENVRTELMRYPVSPYIPNLSMWANKVKQVK